MDRMKAKAIRLFLGDSMEEFGKRIGVAPSTISAIENGRRDITDYVRSKLVRIEMTLPKEFYTFFELMKKCA